MLPDYMYKKNLFIFGPNTKYDDSFGKKTISDYIEYAEEEKEPITGDFPADTPMFQRYTRRQVHIIKGTLPSKQAKVSRFDLLNILDRAERYEDEDTIAAILDNYADLLDEEDYSCPNVTDDEFEALLAKFSTFGK